MKYDYALVLPHSRGLPLGVLYSRRRHCCGREFYLLTASKGDGIHIQSAASAREAGPLLISLFGNSVLISSLQLETFIL